MICRSLYCLALAGFVLALAPNAQAENNFLDQFRYNPEFDKPKYKKYERENRRIGNFGSAGNTFSGTGNSGLFFERRRISQPGDSGLRRDDQNTQINLKIAF